MTRFVLSLCVVVGVWAGTGPAKARKTPADPVKSMERTLVGKSVSGPVLTALGQFQQVSGLRLKVDWEALQDTGIKRSDKLTVKLPKATAGQFLDVMLAQIAKKGKPLAWYIDGEFVRVTTQARVLHRARLPIRARAGGLTKRRAGPLGKLAFDRTPLGDVIAYFRGISRLNLHVNWRSLELIGITRETPVTLHVSNVTLGRALTLVTDQLSPSRSKLDRVYWVVDGGVVTIATGSSLNTRLRTRIYDVADLLLVVPNFKGPRISLDDTDRSNSGNSSDTGFNRSLFDDEDENDENDEDSIAEQRQKVRKELVAIIKDVIGEDMWQPVGKGSIRLFGKRLIISQTLLGYKLLEEARRLR